MSTAKRKREPLSRERIMEAAIALADREGLDALSMRKLAHALGVEAMSLYNHVESKDDLLDGLAERVAAGIDLARDCDDWKTGMRRRTISAHKALTSHKWAATLWMTTKGFGIERLRYGDAVLWGLRQGGFSEELTYHAFHVLQAHVLGYTLQESNLQFEEGELKELAARFLEQFPADDYPDMALHVRQHMEPGIDDQDAFEFGLDLILDSLETLRDVP